MDHVQINVLETLKGAHIYHKCKTWDEPRVPLNYRNVRQFLAVPSDEILFDCGLFCHVNLEIHFKRNLL